jgi:hypothetical protein
MNDLSRVQNQISKQSKDIDLLQPDYIPVVQCIHTPFASSSTQQYRYQKGQAFHCSFILSLHGVSRFFGLHPSKNIIFLSAGSVVGVSFFPPCHFLTGHIRYPLSLSLALHCENGCIQNWDKVLHLLIKCHIGICFEKKGLFVVHSSTLESTMCVCEYAVIICL